MKIGIISDTPYAFLREDGLSILVNHGDKHRHY